MRSSLVRSGCGPADADEAVAGIIPSPPVAPRPPAVPGTEGSAEARAVGRLHVQMLEEVLGRIRELLDEPRLTSV